MTVYVDDAIHPFGRMKMAHMFADSVEELLAMAAHIGVDKKWIQGHPTLSFGKHRNASWIHFDIAKGKRDLAIKKGAKPVDRYECLAHVARLDIASGNPQLVERGQHRLRMVNNARRFKKNSPTHVLFKTCDNDAPDCIKDRNGEVVLGLCRLCNRGEIELSEPCTGSQFRFSATYRRR